MEFFVVTGFASFALLAMDLHGFVRSAAVLQPGAGAATPALAVPSGHAVSSAVEYDRAA